MLYLATRRNIFPGFNRSITLCSPDDKNPYSTRAHKPSKPGIWLLRKANENSCSEELLAELTHLHQRDFGLFWRASPTYPIVPHAFHSYDYGFVLFVIVRLCTSLIVVVAVNEAVKCSR